MCGITCYVGNRPAAPILLDGLKQLEYRGYDSSGLALFGTGGIDCHKVVGKIRALELEVNGHRWQAGGGGIAHTRWATHGMPTVENSHPHSDCRNNIFVVHNGIIENYLALKNDLLAKGHTFRSQTDTEVLAHLIEHHLKGDLPAAVASALKQVRGTYGIAVISATHPGMIVAARKGSPLVLGVGEQEVFAASDVSALLPHTKDVVYLEDGDIATLFPSSYDITNLGSTRVSRSIEKVEWDVDAAQKRGFPHFMLKEIHEQPEAIESALRGRLNIPEGTARLGGLQGVCEQLAAAERLVIVSCGTSYYAGMVGRCVIESLTGLHVDVELASEFRYRRAPLGSGTVVLAISQSGETADTLAAVREAKRQGALVLGLVNAVGSSIAREADAGVYNHAGPEISVASTKAFTSQLTVLYLMALFLARQRKMSVQEGQAFITELQSIPRKIQSILSRAQAIQQIALQYADRSHFFYLGRQFNYPIALEGALKLKEISYIHSEAYAAGEMKHGPIALIDRSFPTLCLTPDDTTFEKMASNIQEIKARGGPVIGVGTEGSVLESCDDWIGVPKCAEAFTPFLTIVPLQLFAYYVACQNNRDIDQPRNLAKSVTVE